MASGDGGTGASLCEANANVDCSACNAGYHLSQPAGVGIQQQAAVSAASHGGIEQHAFIGQFGQCFQYLLRQHRLVMKGTAQVRKGMAQGPS